MFEHKLTYFFFPVAMFKAISLWRIIIAQQLLPTLKRLPYLRSALLVEVLVTEFISTVMHWHA